MTGRPMDATATTQGGVPYLNYHPLGDRTEGEAIVAGMNLMGYDAMALGPKDLSVGVDVLRRRMSEADFAILSANVVVTQTNELLAPAYALIEIGAYRVGVLGITRRASGVPPELEVGDAGAALARWLPWVAGRADVIVLLTNMDFRSAIGLATEVQGIDLLVAAMPGQLPSTAIRLPETGTLAVTAEQPVVRHSGRNVGQLVLMAEPDGSLSMQSWRSLSMDKSLADDLEMQMLLESYQWRP